MKTCHKLLIAALFLFSANHGFSQKKIDTARINFIKRQYAEINSELKTYKKVSKTDTAETTEGNGIILYYKNKEIKKISAMYYGETGKALEEYYFFNGKLIFCYCADYKYNMPIYETGGGKVASTSEERIYLNDGKIFLLKKKPAVSQYFSEFPEDPVKEAQRLIILKSSADD